jgi:hypothetical protein
MLLSMFQLILLVYGRPWLINWFVFNIVGRIGSNFVLGLFVVYMIFLSCWLISELLVYYALYL